MSLSAGGKFAGYTILRRLGSGGMGEVYLVQHPRLPRHDALKILPPELTTDNDFRERFNREADLAAALWHPHIVGVHDRGEYDGQLWLSMDYVDGMDASRFLRDRYPAGMKEEEAVEIVKAIADALDHAHDPKLLHRDVKPASILLSFHQQRISRVLLADFGIARKLDDVSGLTVTNMTIGTVMYAAPEQLIGEQLDGRTDQYALAATAYHLLGGTPPFEHSNPAVVIGNHLHTSPAPLSRLRSELAHLDEPLRRALAKDPAHRFNTCTDFANALNRPTNSRPRTLHTAVAETAPSHPPSPPQYSASSAPTQHAVSSAPTQHAASSFATRDAVSTSTSPQTDGHRASRQTWIIVAAVSAIAIVGAIAVAFVLTTSKEDSPQGESPTYSSSTRSRPPRLRYRRHLPAALPRHLHRLRLPVRLHDRRLHPRQRHRRDTGEARGPWLTHHRPAVPTGMEDAGSRTPEWAYGAILSTNPAFAADPPTIIAMVSKLTSNVDPLYKILELVLGELRNLPGYDGAAEGITSELSGFDAVQLGGTYVKDGVRRAIAQKTVVIPGQGGLFVLQLNAEGLENQRSALTGATGGH